MRSDNQLFSLKVARNYEITSILQVAIPRQVGEKKGQTSAERATN